MNRAEPATLFFIALGLHGRPPACSLSHVVQVSRKIAAVDLGGGLRGFADSLNGLRAWDSLRAPDRQMRKDNAVTPVIRHEPLQVPLSLGGFSMRPSIYNITLANPAERISCTNHPGMKRSWNERRPLARSGSRISPSASTSHRKPSAVI